MRTITGLFIDIPHAKYKLSSKYPNADASLNDYRSGNHTSQIPTFITKSFSNAAIMPTIASVMYEQVYIEQVVTQTANLTYFKVWNADEYKTLNLQSIRVEGYDNLSVSNVRFPLDIEPREVKNILLSLENISGNINSNITFTFSDRVVTVPFIVKRSSEWLAVPDEAYTEAYVWFTDVVSTYNSEQRVSVRVNPRIIINHSYTIESLRLLEQQGLASKLAGKLYSIPLWSDLQEVKDIKAGAKSISTPRQASHFLINASSLLLRLDGESFIYQIDRIDDTDIYFKETIEFSAELAYIAPIVATYCPQGMTYTHGHNEVVTYNAEFHSDNLTAEAKNPYPVHRGYPAVTDAPTTYNSTVTSNVRIAQELLDNVSGAVGYVNTRAVKQKRSVISYVANNTRDIQRIKQWFGFLKGRRQAFWMPTFNRDFDLAEAVADNLSTISITGNHSEFIRDGACVYLRLKGGTCSQPPKQWFLDVEGSSFANGVTTLSIKDAPRIDTGSGSKIEPYQVDRICVAYLCRLDTDKVEYTYQNWHSMTVNCPIVTINYP